MEEHKIMKTTLEGPKGFDLTSTPSSISIYQV